MPLYTKLFSLSDWHLIHLELIENNCASFSAEDISQCISMGMERFVALHFFLLKERKRKRSIPIENDWQNTPSYFPSLKGGLEYYFFSPTYVVTFYCPSASEEPPPGERKAFVLLIPLINTLCLLTGASLG